MRSCDLVSTFSLGVDPNRRIGSGAPVYAHRLWGFCCGGWAAGSGSGVQQHTGTVLMRGMQGRPVLRWWVLTRACPTRYQIVMDLFLFAL